MEVLHRNEQDAALRAATSGRLACVVAHTSDGLEVLVGRDELAGCGGSVEQLGDLLDERLAGRAPG